MTVTGAKQVLTPSSILSLQYVRSVVDFCCASQKKEKPNYVEVEAKKKKGKKDVLKGKGRGLLI